MKTGCSWLLFSFCCMAGCQLQNTTSGYVLEKKDNELDNIVGPRFSIDTIATGLQWSEGPLWLEKENKLLFSDVPNNIIYQWTETIGKSVYLIPSGYTDTVARGGETGSNGLLTDPSGRLVLCQHGNRQVARMEAPLEKPAARFFPLANLYNGKRFNSPNDAVYDQKGNLFFTDPPYGLEKNMEDPQKEIAFQGVYRLDTNGRVTLLVDTISRPNGIAFFPDGKKMIIANSDPLKPYWYLYEVTEQGRLTNGSLFYHPTGSLEKLPGVPDGLKIDKNGNVFASGPGGIWIFNKDGKWLGRIRLQDPVSNCALSVNQKLLFVTNKSRVLRIKLRD